MILVMYDYYAATVKHTACYYGGKANEAAAACYLATVAVAVVVCAYVMFSIHANIYSTFDQLIGMPVLYAAAVGSCVAVLTVSICVCVFVDTQYMRTQQSDSTSVVSRVERVKRVKEGREDRRSGVEKQNQ